MLSLAGVALSTGVWAYNTPCPHSSTMGNSNPLVRLCNPKLARKITILVADFEGTELDNYRVTDTILKNLKLATAEYSDVGVKPLGKTITEREGSQRARKVGKKYNASIVIWGWYDKTETTVPLSVNFEVLAKPKYFPELESTAQGEIQTFGVAELENFQIQTQVSEEMSYLTLVTLGLSCYAVEDWDGTLKRLTDALAQEKTDESALNPAAVHVYLGNAYRCQQEDEKAIASYNRAIELDPDDAFAYNNRGVVYSNKEEYEKAIADYNRAIELDSDFACVYNNRGVVYSNKEEYEKAIADYNRAIELDSDFAGAYYNRGNAYYNKEEYEKAFADYNRAIELDRDFSESYHNRGFAYNYLEEYEKAIADYNRALELDPDDARAYHDRGNAYYYKEEYEKAIADYTRAIELDPDDAWAYVNRGKVYSRQGNTQKAKADFQAALELTNDRGLIQEIEQLLREVQ